MKIGITGNMGSGKSICADILSNLYGFTIIDADKIGKDITLKNEKVKEELVSQFSEDIIEDDLVNKEKLVRVLFSDSQRNIKILNNIVHPILLDEIERRVSDSGKIVLDAALLFQWHIEDLFDFTVSVYSPKELRIKRIMDRMGLSYDEVLGRMSAQDYTYRLLSKSDYVVENSGTLVDLEFQIRHIIEDIK